MKRTLFGLAAVWEIARFALLFSLVHTSSADESAGFAATALWFGSSQLAIAAAMLYAAVNPGGLGRSALNIARVGKALSVVTGGIAVLSRIAEAVAGGLINTPVEWFRHEPLMSGMLVLDFTMVVFLLSYQPQSDSNMKPNLPGISIYDVTDLEEE